MRRRSIRHPEHDYHNPGAYFVTICAQGNNSYFGSISIGEMHLNHAGQMVQNCWTNIPKRQAHTEIDGFVVMPNHFHGILLLGMTRLRDAWIREDEPVMTPLLGDVMGGFKSLTTHEYILGVKNNGWVPFQTRLWQRNYYERVIRTEKEFAYIKQYILTNPARWDLDAENTGRVGIDEFDTWLQDL